MFYYFTSLPYSLGLKMWMQSEIWIFLRKGACVERGLEFPSMMPTKNNLDVLEMKICTHILFPEATP